MNDLIIEKYAEATPQLLEELYQLEVKIFDKPLSQETIKRELQDKKMLALIARYGPVPVGYKVGFEHSTDIFYSWIGGVDPHFRRQGIAGRLMDAQHSYAKELGYTYVRTATKNKYRDMLLLNIRHGFDVIGVQRKLRESDLSIVLEKEL